MCGLVGTKQIHPLILRRWKYYTIFFFAWSSYQTRSISFHVVNHKLVFHTHNVVLRLSVDGLEKNNNNNDNNNDKSVAIYHSTDISSIWFKSFQNSGAKRVF